MAWISVELAEESDQERDGRLEHVQTWRCVTNNPGVDRVGSALSAVGIPAYGANYGDGTLCLDRRARLWPGAANNIAQVQVTFRQRTGGSSDTTTPPLLRPLEFRGQPQSRTEAYDVDAAGNKCAMTNGVYMEPLPQRDASDNVIVIEGNFATNDVAADDAIKHTINSTSVVVDGVTYAAKTLLLGPIAWRKTREVINGVTYTYYRKTFELKVAAGGWDAVPVESRGYVDVNHQEIWTDGEGHSTAPHPSGEVAWPVKEPWPLDDMGYAVTTLSAGHTIELQPYAAATWPYDFSGA